MLQVLKGRAIIDGLKVVIMDEIRESHPELFGESGAMDWKKFEAEIRPHADIMVRFDKQSLSFNMGAGKCDIDALISVAIKLLILLYGEKEGGFTFEDLMEIVPHLLTAKRKIQEIRKK